MIAFRLYCCQCLNSHVENLQAVIVGTCQNYNITHTFPIGIILLQNQEFTLLCEVEKKRSHLAALKKRCEEVNYLLEQSEMLSREKKRLGSLVGKLQTF